MKGEGESLGESFAKENKETPDRVARVCVLSVSRHDCHKTVILLQWNN